VTEPERLQINHSAHEFQLKIFYNRDLTSRDTLRLHYNEQRIKALG